MSKRYDTPGPWVRDKNYATRIGAVNILIGPAVDTKTSTTYPQGAHKVCVSGPGGKPRTRTFIGESAWCQAENYAERAQQWLNSWRNDSYGSYGESTRDVS